jgi:hypothetical protein
VNYSQVSKDRVPPPKTVVVEPEAFAPNWGHRPKTAVAVGLQNLSDDDETTARSEAEKFTNRLGHEDRENWIDAFNDALMAELVARSVCDPNDVRNEQANLPLPEDHLRAALTPAGIRYLYDELERLKVESSPLHPEATDAELTELVEALAADDILSTLDPVAEKRVRRFLLFCLDEIRGEVVPEDDDEDDLLPDP